MMIKMLQCAKTVYVDLYVTFGLVDKLMYLIRKYYDQYRKFVGTIEPSAVLQLSRPDERLLEYFKKSHLMFKGSSFLR